MKSVHSIRRQLCILSTLLLCVRSEAGFIVASGDWQDTANWSGGTIDGTVNNNGTAIFDPVFYGTGTTATMPAGNTVSVGGTSTGTSTLNIVSGTFGNSAVTLTSNYGNRKAAFEVSGGTVVFGDAGLAAYSNGDVTWTQTGGSTTFGAGAGRTTLASEGKNVMSFSGASQFTINTTGDVFAQDIVNGAGSDLTVTFSGSSSFTTTGPTGTGWGIKTDRQFTSKSLWHFEGSGVSTSIRHLWEPYAGTTFRFTADAGGVSPVNITTTGESWNRLNLANNAPTLQVDIAAYQPFAGITLFTYPSRTGTFGTVEITQGGYTLSPFTGTFTTAEALPGGQYYLDYGTTAITLYYHAIPEPNSLLLMGLGGGLLFLFRGVGRSRR